MAYELIIYCDMVVLYLFIGSMPILIANQTDLRLFTVDEAFQDWRNERGIHATTKTC